MVGGNGAKGFLYLLLAPCMRCGGGIRRIQSSVNPPVFLPGANCAVCASSPSIIAVYSGGVLGGNLPAWERALSLCER